MTAVEAGLSRLTLYALVHVSDDFARTAEMPRTQALRQLIASVERLFAAS